MPGFVDSAPTLNQNWVNAETLLRAGVEKCAQIFINAHKTCKP